MNGEPSGPHVLIIGAGLTGLAVAQGLKKAGITYTIFEQEEPNDNRRKEWSMGIHWGLPYLESLLPSDLFARLISEATVDPSLDYVTPPTNGSIIYDGVTGDVMTVLKSDDKLVRASRRKLRKLLSEGVDIQYNHTLHTITSNSNGSVTAHFTNSTSYTGTLLLGADGAHSAVRTHLLSSNPSISPLATPMTNLIQLSTIFRPGIASRALFLRSNSHPVWCVMLHPRVFLWLCMQDVPDPEAPETWVFFVFFAWKPDPGEDPERMKTASPGERLGALRERVKGAEMAEPFRSLIEWFPEDFDLKFVEANFWVAEDWDSDEGRVTLAGDAAHPMPPYRGQGLNNALLDAGMFVKVVERLSKGERERGELVGEYSREVVKRGAEETKLTLKNGYMLVSYDEAKESPYFRQGLRKGGNAEEWKQKQDV